MIILDATDQSLEVVLNEAKTTNDLDWVTSYVDVTTTTYTPSSNDGVTNGTTFATIVAAPSASTQRQIKQITVYNNDTKNSTVTIRKNINSTLRILCKIVLHAGDVLQYNDGEGFKVIDNTGSLELTSGTTLGFSGGTTSNSSTNVLVFSNSNGVSFGMSNSTITAQVSTLSMSFYEPPNKHYVANSAPSTSSGLNLSLQRFIMPYYMTATRLDFFASITAAGNQAGTWSISAGIYTRGTNNALYTASTTSSGQTWAVGGATTDISSYSGISGLRVRSLAPNNWAFTPGEYWLGFLQLYSSPAGTTANISYLGISSQGVLNVVGTNKNEVAVWQPYGIYGSGTGALPMVIEKNQIAWNSGGNTGSLISRQPFFRLFGSY